MLLKTRITSKYTVLKPSASKIKKRQKYAAKQAAKPAETARTSSPPPQSSPQDATATFVLKTYDPVSGTCLQYETTKGAEVGRLVNSLGRLGREMAALPQAIEDLSAPQDAGVATPNVDEGGFVKTGGVPVPAAAGTGGGKKKKKGKK